MTQTKFTQELFDAICDRIANGESLRAICAESGMPKESAFRYWANSDDALSAQYARAREDRGLYYGEKVAEVSDGVLAGQYDPVSARVAIDGYKWTAGRLASKVYGDKVDHTSSDGSMTPTPTIIQLIPVEPDIDDSAG